jgi:hypothetical protein
VVYMVSVFATASGRKRIAQANSGKSGNLIGTSQDDCFFAVLRLYGWLEGCINKLWTLNSIWLKD